MIFILLIILISGLSSFIMGDWVSTKFILLTILLYSCPRCAIDPPLDRMGGSVNTGAQRDDAATLGQWLLWYYTGLRPGLEVILIFIIKTLEVLKPNNSNFMKMFALRSETKPVWLRHITATLCWSQFITWLFCTNKTCDGGAVIVVSGRALFCKGWYD